MSLIKNGKTNSQFFTYSFGKSKIKNTEKSEEGINTLQNIYESNFNSKDTNNYNSHNFYYAFDQVIGKKNSLGFQWTGSFNDRHGNSKMFTNITSNQNEYFTKNDINDKYKGDFNDFNLNYSLINDTVNDFKIITDYALSNSNMTMNNYQTFNGNNSTYFNKSKSDYKIFSIQSNYAHNFHKINMNVIAGIKYSNVINNNNSTFTTDANTTDLINLFNYKTKLDETYGAAYVKLKKSFKKTSFAIGARVENNKWQLTEDSSKKTTYKDFYFFPNFSFNYDIKDNLSLSLNYNKYINRVTYSSISQEYIYINPYLIRVGNPYLKPTITHDIAFSLNMFNTFFVSGGYEYIKNYSTMAFHNLDSIILVKYENFEKQNLYGNFYLSIQKEKISLNVGFAITKSFFVI